MEYESNLETLKNTLEDMLILSANIKKYRDTNNMKIVKHEDSSHNKIEQNGEINKPDAQKCLNLLDEKIQYLFEKADSSKITCQNFYEKELEAKEQQIESLKHELKEMLNLMKKDCDYKESLKTMLKELEKKNELIFTMRNKALYWELMNMLHEMHDISYEVWEHKFSIELNKKEEHIIQLETELKNYKNHKNDETNVNMDTEDMALLDKNSHIAESEQEIINLKSIIEIIKNDPKFFDTKINNTNKEREIFLQQQINKLKSNILNMMNTTSSLSVSDICTAEHLKNEILDIKGQIKRAEEEDANFLRYFHNFPNGKKLENGIHKLIKYDNVKIKSKLAQLEELSEKMLKYIEEKNIKQLKETLISNDDSIRQLKQTNAALAMEIAEYEKTLSVSEAPTNKNNHQDNDVNLQNSMADKYSPRIYETDTQELEKLTKATKILILKKDEIIDHQKSQISVLKNKLRESYREKFKLERNSKDFWLLYEKEADIYFPKKVLQIDETYLEKNDMAFNLNSDIAQEIEKAYSLKFMFHYIIGTAIKRKRTLKYERVRNQHLLTQIATLNRCPPLIESTPYAPTCESCEMHRSQMNKYIKECYRHLKKQSCIRSSAFKILIEQKRAKQHVLKYMQTKSISSQEESQKIKEDMLVLMETLKQINTRFIYYFYEIIDDDLPTSSNSSNSNISNDNDSDDRDSDDRDSDDRDSDDKDSDDIDSDDRNSDDKGSYDNDYDDNDFDESDFRHY